MSIFNQPNIPSSRNGFFYLKGKVEINLSSDFIYNEQNSLFTLNCFQFFQDGMIVSNFEIITMNKDKNIITIGHFAVDTNYLEEHKNGGLKALVAFSKLVREQLPCVDKIDFELYKNGNRDQINDLCLAGKRAALFGKIGATSVEITQTNNSYRSYIVKASWKKDAWSK